jgi:hypothetical protein
MSQQTTIIVLESKNVWLLFYLFIYLCIYILEGRELSFFFFF